MLRFVKERLYYLSAMLIRRLALWLPRKVALAAGAALANIIFNLSTSDKRRAYENLRVYLGIRNPQVLADISRRCFWHWGKSVIEVMRFPKLTREKINEFVTCKGIQNLNTALKAGHGVILLTAHFGNWELMGASLALNGYILNALAREVRSQHLEKLLKAHRQSVGVRVIHRGASVKTGLRCLKRNEILAVLADVDTKADGVFVDFFGRLAYTPYAPVAISLKTKALLVPAFIIRQPYDSHIVVIEKPLELQLTGQKDVDIQVNTQLFTKVVESYVRKYPEQWVWMHQRWKTRPPEERKQENERKNDDFPRE